MVKVKKRKKEVDGEDEAEEVETKVGKTGSVICEGCRARGTGVHAVSWAATTGRAAKPSGNKCLACHSLHLMAFRYLDWKAFCKMQDSEERDCLMY